MFRRLAIRLNFGGGTTSVGGTAPKIVQLPARSLWSTQFPVDKKYLTTSSFQSMLRKLREAREYYKYPSLCAPQIGWNVRLFILSDGSCWVNPDILSTSDVDSNDPSHKRRCWAWEPCASCAALMHYIERPYSCRIKGLNEYGEVQEKEYDKMLARLVLHEMDHLEGVLFTRRVPDGNHIVPLDGFYSMSDWPDDFPSVEGRSTFLYNCFVPPATMIPDSVPDANIMERRFEDGVYPGHDSDVAMEESQRRHERNLKAQYQKKRDEAAEEEQAQLEPYSENDAEAEEGTPDGNDAEKTGKE